MSALFSQVLRHVSRTKLIYFLFLMALLIQFGGMFLLKQAFLHLPTQIWTGAPREILFVSFFLQLFPGTFLAAVFGIWTAPYLHHGQRGLLAFALPLEKWKFALCYAVSMLAFLVVLHGIMIGAHVWAFGKAGFFADTGFNRGVIFGLILQTVAFEAVMFAFALGTLVVGQAKTFFAGIFTLMLLQALSIFAHARFTWNGTEVSTEGSPIVAIYRFLPPVGELPFDLWLQITRSTTIRWDFLIWVLWLGMLFALFVYKLKRPTLARFSDIG